MIRRAILCPEDLVQCGANSKLLLAVSKFNHLGYFVREGGWHLTCSPSGFYPPPPRRSSRVPGPSDTAFDDAARGGGRSRWLV